MGYSILTKNLKNIQIFLLFFYTFLQIIKIAYNGNLLILNFEKFLLSREGKLIKRFRSSVDPNQNELIMAIESLL